jgi:hypothetical protein
MTHTYVTLEVSHSAFAEIYAKLEAAGYDHALNVDLIDMHGIALVPGPPTPDIEISVEIKEGGR